MEKYLLGTPRCRHPAQPRPAPPRFAPPLCAARPRAAPSRLRYIRVLDSIRFCKLLKACDLMDRLRNASHIPIACSTCPIQDPDTSRAGFRFALRPHNLPSRRPSYRKQLSWTSLRMETQRAGFRLACCQK